MMERAQFTLQGLMRRKSEELVVVETGCGRLDEATRAMAKHSLRVSIHFDGMSESEIKACATRWLNGEIRVKSLELDLSERQDDEGCAGRLSVA